MYHSNGFQAITLPELYNCQHLSRTALCIRIIRTHQDDYKHHPLYRFSSNWKYEINSSTPLRSYCLLQKSLLKVFKYKYSYRYLHCILTFLALALLSPPFFNKFKYRDDNSLETTVSTLSSHCHLSAMLGPLTSIISHCNNRWRIQWRHGCILHQRVSTSRCTSISRYHSVRIHQRCTQKYTESSPRWHSV